MYLSSVLQLKEAWLTSHKRLARHVDFYRPRSTRTYHLPNLTVPTKYLVRITTGSSINIYLYVGRVGGSILVRATVGGFMPTYLNKYLLGTTHI